MFQAFIDDSGTKGTGKLLMLGGLFGRAETLATVADAWSRELRARIPLAIAYFKAEEARNIDGEFSDWRRSGRDEKVRRLAAVIDRPDLLMVYCAVDLGSHRIMESYVGSAVTDAKRHPFNQPYIMAALTILLTIASEASHYRPDEKVEVVFDEQVVFRRDVKFQYELLRQLAPPPLARCLPLEPWFRDDKDFVVLQAADLLMGNARMVAGKTSKAKWPQLEWHKLKASQLAQTYSHEQLSGLTVHHLSRMLGVPRDAFKVTIVRPADSDETKS